MEFKIYLIRIKNYQRHTGLSTNNRRDTHLLIGNREEALKIMDFKNEISIRTL